MILVTGGTGFIGTATLAALSRRHAPLRLLVHHRPPTIDSQVVDLIHADLADPASLAGICAGADTLVHLAAEIGDDEQRCAAVNVDGTRALLAEARRAGVRRMIYLSTAAVYGRRGHPAGTGQRGIAEDELPPAPASAASRTRLLAERAVRAAGGLALRPMFVYGPGDVWFVPALVHMLRQTPLTIDGGRARQSTVAVDDLAAAIAALAVDGWPATGPGVLHVAHPKPVTVAEIVATLAVRLGLPTPRRDLSYQQAQALLRDDPRLDLIATDHFYAGGRLWRLTGVRPSDFAEGFARHADWYRAALDLPAGEGSR